MKIIYKKGDFLKGREWFIAHGCNAQGVMASGAAKQVRAEYPEAYTEYRKAYVRNGKRLAVGSVVTAVHEESGLIIFNAITQQFYGRDKDVVYVSYEGIHEAFCRIDRIMATQNPNGPHDLRVAMPKIGAGLANGDWERIACIIEATAGYYQPVVYEL